MKFDHFLPLLAERYAANPPVALPGVEDALRALKARGIKVELTTGFSRDVAVPILLVTSDEVAAGRPAPYMIHRVMEVTGVHDVRSVVAGGDTVVDLLAARHAGVKGLGVLTAALGRDELERHPHNRVLGGGQGLSRRPRIRPNQPPIISFW